VLQVVVGVRVIRYSSPQEAYNSKHENVFFIFFAKQLIVCRDSRFSSVDVEKGKECRVM